MKELNKDLRCRDTFKRLKYLINFNFTGNMSENKSDNYISRIIHLKREINSIIRKEKNCKKLIAEISNCRFWKNYTNHYKNKPTNTNSNKSYTKKNRFTFKDKNVSSNEISIFKTIMRQNKVILKNFKENIVNSKISNDTYTNFKRNLRKIIDYNIRYTLVTSNESIENVTAPINPIITVYPSSPLTIKGIDFIWWITFLFFINFLILLGVMVSAFLIPEFKEFDIKIGPFFLR
ncbi:uncharacterized protein LOC111621394 isoform X1 [Centruroides sculpturatus]|uniref:uncharacterized protein LOC111621394 isoform X1 n=1 Tax=Centruroides sculpturatus TaxID=218467 RepID=UPI000C6D5416|nr:uncharacterized protein LOC111621394 isoform X1 [Centruroides sculpturatus]